MARAPNEDLDKLRKIRTATEAERLKTAKRKSELAQRRLDVDLGPRIQAAKSMEELSDLAREVAGHVASGALSAREGEAIRALIGEARRAHDRERDYPQEHGPGGGSVAEVALGAALAEAETLDMLDDALRSLMRGVAGGEVQANIGNTLKGIADSRRQALKQIEGRGDGASVLSGAIMVLSPEECAIIKAHRERVAGPALKPGDPVPPPEPDDDD